ncbi:MAG: LamG-like jellyroll fold domain-containing protein, partial [Candidatus Promineifilaceae bacterium]
MKKRHLYLYLIFCLSLFIAVIGFPRFAMADEPDANNLQTVWEHVRDAGAYHFSADLTQTTQNRPSPSANEPSTQKSQAHIEGQTDLTADVMELTLWKGSGSVLLPETGTQIKVEGGTTYARQGTGAWQLVDDFSGTFAPGGDFTAFLVAAENVVRYAPETKSTPLGDMTITRFTFDISGPHYAVYMRDLLDSQMREHGELPPGMKLDIPEIYSKMMGQGELWVGQNGLPVSQRLELTFPEDAFEGLNKQTTFQVDVQFSHFKGYPETIVSSSSNTQPSPLSNFLHQGKKVVEKAAVPENFFAILAIVVIIALMLIVSRYSHAKPVYAAVVLSVSISMLVSPMLSSIHLEAFNQEQKRKQAVQESQQAEADKAASWQEALADPGFDAHTNPLDAAKSRLERPQVNGNGIMGSGIITATSSSSKYFDSACETNPGDDNDGDSLTNLQECLIGTLPGAIDTDQDGVNDGLEVKGFSYEDGGEIWYTNPLHPDTDRDGLGDGTEWFMDVNADGKPDDTDGDGIPDVWDSDNDDDGVPDDLDLSPFSTTKNSNIFDGDSPFQLIVNDLEEGLFTKVEFQLSPTNPDHLWYTNNVLNWADNDRQGQMQDADGKTFYDINPDTNPWPNSLGDVRLVPMLEIEMTGTPNNLLDMATLDMFGISVLTNTNDSVTAYVPMQLVTENTGEKNVAFQGAMYYRADSSWGNAQSVRLVWLVQALVDVCDTYKNGICDTYSKYNDVQIIHSYDEEWYLTGMEISEEHGTNMAIIYEDPTETTDSPLYMDNLYEMAYGLDRTFMAGADCETIDTNNECLSGNGKLDLTVTGIYTRFNHLTNTNVPEEKRWGLSNVYSVVENSYEAVELAMLDAAITQTVDALNNNFTSFWTDNEPITPTVMFAWEHEFRAVSLSSSNLSWSGDVLKADVARSGNGIIQVEQVNGIKWAPYSYTTTDGWVAADINTYWTNLDNLLPDYMGGSDDVAADVAMGKLLYLGMYNGEVSNIKFGDSLIPKPYEINDLPLQLKIASLVGAGVKKVIAYYYGGSSTIGRIVRAAVDELDEDISVLQRFTTQLQNDIAYLYSKLQSFGNIGIGLTVLTTLALLAVAGYYFFRKFVSHDSVSTGWLIAGGVAVGVFAVALGIIKPIRSMISQVESLIELGEAENTLDAVLTVFGGEGSPSIEYNILGLIIGILVATAFFLTLVLSGQVHFGSIGFNSLLAQTIAAIIVALIIFVINLTGIGALLLGIATVVDLILLALGINFSIVGKLTDAIASALYEFDLSVNAGVFTGGVSTKLVNPDDGMVAGNQMIYSMPITTVITQSVDMSISEDEFRSNSLVYEFDHYDAYQLGLSTTHGDRSDEWAVSPPITVNDVYTPYLGTVYDTVTYQATLTAGVNKSNIFYLDSAYDFLGESCWKVVSSCKNKYVSGTSSTEVGSTFVFDIYPATIDGFVDVTSWSTGNLRFPDADGDGLLPLGEGGIDPDDSKWDYDGDGLSDKFEISMRSLTVEDGGEVLDPMLMDTDGDGISDREELLLATNPANPDSDNDGLPDIDEAAQVDESIPALTGGWYFAYSINSFTNVWSDPNSSDYDGDGMTDLFELTQDTCPDCSPWADPDNPLLFSPYVYNENPVPIYLDDNTNNGFVSPSTSFVYSTTTENNLSDGILLAGDVSLQLPNFLAGIPLTADVALNSGYSETLVSEIAPIGSSSATGVLTSSMDLEAFEDVVWAWDPVESNSMAPIGGDIKSLDATVAPGFSDLYIYTALEIDDNGTKYITVYTAGNDGNPSDSAVLDSIDASTNRIFTAPSVACNNSGVCLVVWGEPNYPNGGVINGIMLNGSVDQISILSSIKSPDYDGVTVSAPAIASDGGNFMVGWTQNPGTVASTWVRQVFADGSFSSLQQVWELDNDGDNSIGIDWTGSNYLAVWFDSPNAIMYRAEIDTSLNVGPVTTIPGEALIFANVYNLKVPLTLTYDPLSNQALVLYRDMDDDVYNAYAYYMSIRRLTADGSSEEIYLDTVDQYSHSYADTAVCADPQNGGWIVVWSKNEYGAPGDLNIHYQAIGPDGSLRGSEQLVSTTDADSAVAIACRSPHPLLDLEFEETATSNTYADSSQYGHDATCDLDNNSCPLGGIEGRYGNGVQFDGSNDQLTNSFTQPTDEFTVEFWMKTSCQDCDILTFLGGHVDIYLNNGEVCQRASSGSIYGISCSPSGTNYADGEWHHVIQATDGSAQFLWLDGDIQITTSYGFSNINCTSNCTDFVLGTAGDNFYDGILDRVRFHNRRFTQAEAFQSFSSAVTILDLDEVAGATTAYDASNSGYNATCSGSSCPTFGVDGIANTAVQFDGSDDYLAIDTQKRTLEYFVYQFENGNTSG